jgi:hypothetical protein
MKATTKDKIIRHLKGIIKAVEEIEEEDGKTSSKETIEK